MIVMKLYEITELQNELEKEDDAEIKQDLQELIAIELEKKSNNIVYALKNIESNNLAIDAEIERLQSLKKRNSKNIESIKANVLFFMQQNKIDKIKTDLATFSLRKSESTDIENIELLPAKFVTVKQTFTPDKVAIKKEIKEGIEVPGAKIVEDYSLSIK
jgi:c-di-GMP-related signal transduction protein